MPRFVSEGPRPCTIFTISIFTVYMNYETKSFLLVSSSVSTNQLLYFVHGQGQKSEQKHTTKNFVGFHNHSPLLTLEPVLNCCYKLGGKKPRPQSSA